MKVIKHPIFTATIEMTQKEVEYILRLFKNATLVRDLSIDYFLKGDETGSEIYSKLNSLFVAPISKQGQPLRESR